MKFCFKKPFIGILCICIQIVYISMDCKSSKKVNIDISDMEDSALALSVRTACSTFNADITWMNIITQTDFFQPIYTLQLQMSMIKDTCPILFWGSVDDVIEKDNKFFICFVSQVKELFGPLIYFILESSEAQALEVVKQKPNDPLMDKINKKQYVVVATINHITKSTHSTKLDEENSYTTENDFIAEGRCISYIFQDSVLDYLKTLYK